HGNLGRAEGGAAHLHDDELHAAAAHAAVALHHAALGVDGEAVLLGVAVVTQPLGEDPEPVARLLGLAAVGIEDAQPEIRARRRRAHEDAVRADAPVSIADPD